MKYCSKCGAEMEDSCVTCPKCGANDFKGAAKNAAEEIKSTIANTADYTDEYTAEDIEAGKLWSALAYFGITFWLPMVLCPDSKFGKFHANQSLILFIVGAALGIVSGIVGAILGIIPVLGGLLATIISLLINVITLFYFIFGIVNTFMGKAKELPIIGKFRIIK